MKDTVNPRVLKFSDFSLKGVSTAGIGTCLTIPDWKIAFDVAQGLPFAFSMNNFFISHLHQDHASGIPYLISQKAMMAHKSPHFYLPQGAGEPLEAIMKIWSKVEGHSYKYSFTEVRPGIRHHLSGNFYFESFETKHRVQSQGYLLYIKNKRLNPKFRDSSREQILKLKEKGQEVEEVSFRPKLAFTGDTQIEFLDLAPHIKKVENLIMEVTYIDDKKGVDSARKWGHIHFREIAHRIKEIESQNIIWIHLSARYSRSQILEMIQRELPDEVHRIHVL